MYEYINVYSPECLWLAVDERVLLHVWRDEEQDDDADDNLKPFTDRISCW